LLEIKNLVKKYGDKAAVNGLSITVAKGETVVLMGPSGCGKSTTIRCINRITEPTAGEVFFQGQAITQLGHQELLQCRKKIGYVFQQFNLVQRMTALENVMLPLVMDGLDKASARTKATEALLKVGLEQFANQRPAELSGGQQQRVGIGSRAGADVVGRTYSFLRSDFGTRGIGCYGKLGESAQHDDDRRDARITLCVTCCGSYCAHGQRPNCGRGCAARSIRQTTVLCRGTISSIN
jgi:ABC-type uncharacterized transport system YnjBCD ATPase subunit